MNATLQQTHDRLLAAWRAAGQGQVFRFWSGLEAQARRKLLEQLEAVDLDLVRRLVDEHLAAAPGRGAIRQAHGPEPGRGASPRPGAALPQPGGRGESRGPDQAGKPAAAGADPPARPALEPAPAVRLPRTDAERAAARRARDRGEAHLRAGRVGLFMVSGGQGTRLGARGPKGAYPFGPVSDITLFEIFARRIRALRAAFGAALPWAVMTSDVNDRRTRDFFARRDHFGLGAESLCFVKQAMLPAVDAGGRVLLEAPGRLALSPDGHGGSLAAMADGGLLDLFEARGIETIFFWQVDNPLVVIADPLMIGVHLEAEADMSLKVVMKADPLEKVGAWGMVGGRFGVIEYSDLPEEEAHRTDASGELVFGMGSIAIHVFQVAFVRRLTRGGLRLPYHAAHKAVPVADEDGHTVRPETPNACKFETFVFDALPAAERAAALEVRREDEFAPVKSRTGADSVERARRMVSDRNARRLEALGVEVPRDEAGAAAFPIEIDPLLEPHPDRLRAAARAHGPIRGPALIREGDP